VKNADLIFFKRKTNLSWGNLSTHASKLEEAGYIQIDKQFRDKKPVTILEITSLGREAFDKYKEAMKQVLRE
jgi:DNA-binding MarR family transcriptional regulator